MIGSPSNRVPPTIIIGIDECTGRFLTEVTSLLNKVLSSRLGSAFSYLLLLKKLF
jgi:hypothetical protein